MVPTALKGYNCPYFWILQCWVYRAIRCCFNKVENWSLEEWGPCKGGHFFLLLLEYFITYVLDLGLPELFNINYLYEKYVPLQWLFQVVEISRWWCRKQFLVLGKLHVDINFHKAKNDQFKEMIEAFSLGCLPSSRFMLTKCRMLQMEKEWKKIGTDIESTEDGTH